MTSTTVVSRSVSASRPAILMVYGAALLQGLTLVSVPAISSVLKQELGLSDASYGALFLPQVALAVIGAVAGGALARHLGLARLLVLALAANAVSQALLAGSGFGGAESSWLLPAATASLGLGFGLLGGPINVYPGLLFPHRPQPALVAAHTLIGLGLAIGPLLAGLFVATGMWTGFPLSLAGLGLLIAAVIPVAGLPRAILIRTELATTRPTTSARFWLFALITVLYAFAEGTFSSWAVIFLRDSRGLPDITAGWALSAFWGTLVVGRLLISALLVRVAAHRLWLSLPVMMIVAFWLVPTVGGSISGITVFALAGLACSGFLPLTIALASDSFRHAAASVSSLLIAALMTGVGVGSFAVGALQMMVPLDTLYRISSIYPVAVLVLACVVLRPARFPRL